MKIAKFLAIIFASAFGLVAIGSVAFVKFYLSPLAKDWLQTKGTEILGGPVVIESASLSVLPPFGGTLKGVKFHSSKFRLDGEIEKLKFSTETNLKALLNLEQLGRSRVEFVRPRVTWKEKSQAEVSLESSLPTRPPVNPVAIAFSELKLNRDLTLDIAIKDGELHTTSMKLSDIGLQAKIPSLNAKNLEFSLTTKTLPLGEAFKEQWKKEFVLQLEGALSVATSKIEIPKAKGLIDGLAMDLSGFQNAQSGESEWKVKVHAEDLAKMKSTPRLLPEGKWSGSLEADVKFSSAGQFSGQFSPWKSEGRVAIKRLAGETRFSHDEFALNGRFQLDADIDFKAPDLRFSRFEGSAQFSESSVEIKDLFKKSAGVPLELVFKGTGTSENLKFETARLVFASLEAQAAGDLAWVENGQSSFKVEVKRTDLAGWERFFPMLTGAPVKGALELTAQVGGDLMKPESLSIHLAPLLLERIEGNIHWRSKDGKSAVSGPALIDGVVRLDTEGPDVKTASLRLMADFTRMGAEIKDVLTKRAGIPLILNAEAEQRGRQIEVKNASLQFYANRLTASGRVSNPQKPELQLRFNCPSLNLGDLSLLFPRVAETNLSGLANASMSLQGVFDFKEGLSKSPLRLSGELDAQVPHLKLLKAKTSPEITTDQIEPLLPPWPLVESAQVKSEILLGRVQYEDGSADGVQLSLKLQDGALKGTGVIQQVFQGKAKLKHIQAKATAPDPDFDAEIEFTDLSLPEFAGFASKEWRELLQGRATGHARLSIPHPGRHDFAEAFQGHGTIRLKEGSISTMELDQLANEKLTNLFGNFSTGDENPAASSPGLPADISTDFKIEHKSLSLVNLKFLTKEKNELLLGGSIGFDKSLALSGSAHLATAPIAAKVRKASSDSMGRFLIPLTFKGDLSRPEPEFAPEIIAGLLNRTGATQAPAPASVPPETIPEAIPEATPEQ